MRTLWFCVKVWCFWGIGFYFGFCSLAMSRVFLYFLWSEHAFLQLCILFGCVALEFMLWKSLTSLFKKIRQDENPRNMLVMTVSGIFFRRLQVCSHLLNVWCQNGVCLFSLSMSAVLRCRMLRFFLMRFLHSSKLYFWVHQLTDSCCSYMTAAQTDWIL